ncbi:MAG: ABC transporter permease [Acidobacteria bacterium]|nr:ABC transporter permease [Acidobacteriota bacterium]
MVNILPRSLLLTGHQMLAFVFRNYHLTRRYFGWVVVFSFYAVVNSATIALIGVAANDPRLTMTLVIGAMLWGFLSLLFNEVSMAIMYERWEGTLEYTFMAPVSRFAHLIGESLYATIYSMARLFVILLGVALFVELDLSQANWIGLIVTLMVSSLAFIGMGLIAATLPVFSPERGAEATSIFQGSLLLVSGIYYPVEVLPVWLQPLAKLSPATYALSACRKLIGVSSPEAAAGKFVGAPLSAVLPELLTLVLMGVVMIPFGLWVFGRVENWAKRKGKLKRTG